MRTKTIVFWLLGALSIMLGAMIAGNANPTDIGATGLSYSIALIISFVLILTGGLLWITVAGAIHEE